MRRSTRKKKGINYNESDDCNDDTDNNGSSNSINNNGNNVSPLRLTMSLKRFIDGPLSNERFCKGSYKSTFTNYVKTIDGAENRTANDILSPTKGSLFIIDKNARKSDSQQKNVTSAVRAARKCFQRFFNSDPEDTGSSMPKRQVLKEKEPKTIEENSVFKYLQDALNEKLISKQDLDDMTEYYKYRCKHRENLETKGSALHPQLEKALVNTIRPQTMKKNWVFQLPFIQQLYLSRIAEDRKKYLKVLINFLEDFIEGMKKERERLFAEEVENALRGSMFNEDDEDDDDEEEP